jgi:hypothetical protein
MQHVSALTKKPSGFLVKADTRCDSCDSPIPLNTSILQPDVTCKYYILNTETAVLRNVGIFL